MLPQCISSETLSDDKHENALKTSNIDVKQGIVSRRLIHQAVFLADLRSERKKAKCARFGIKYESPQRHNERVEPVFIYVEENLILRTKTFTSVVLSTTKSGR